MARQPAWNTKAERARRATEREQIVRELADFDDSLDELMPLLRAWVKIQSTDEHEAPAWLVATRYGHAAASALELASRWNNRARCR